MLRIWILRWIPIPLEDQCPQPTMESLALHMWVPLGKMRSGLVSENVVPASLLPYRQWIWLNRRKGTPIMHYYFSSACLRLALLVAAAMKVWVSSAQTGFRLLQTAVTILALLLKIFLPECEVEVLALPLSPGRLSFLLLLLVWIFMNMF